MGPRRVVTTQIHRGTVTKEAYDTNMDKGESSNHPLGFNDIRV